MMTALFTGLTALCVGDDGGTAAIDGAITALRRINKSI
jgi:hypothetical protein